MKTNVRIPRSTVLKDAQVALTHEGGTASNITNEQQLRRMTAANMLFEGQFYVDGTSTADLIARLVPHCRPEMVSDLAIAARSAMKLRHVPLLLVREMARGPVAHRRLVARTLTAVIQRPDELAEFLALYWKDQPGAPISAQVKKGLARAFTKFSEYALAKYDRDAGVKLRDVAFMTHVKPQNLKQADLFARLVNKTYIPVLTKGENTIHHEQADKIDTPKGPRSANPGLAVPDTWEVALSAGKGENKKQAWERLLVEKKLGALAFLRNLRNMTNAGVTQTALELYASTLDVTRVLPFRFIAAARVVPNLEPMLEAMMMKALKDARRLPGKTVLLVDISGSMQGQISAKSDLIRLDAAAALAILLREICADVTIGRFDTITQLVPPRHGFALRDAIGKPRGGTDIGQAVAWANRHSPDRIIVFTDEQSATAVGKPHRLGYIMNVAAYQHGVGYDTWHHIHGFSEAVVDYLHVVEEMAKEKA